MTGSGHEMVGITRKYKEEDQNKYWTGEKIGPPVHYWMPRLSQSPPPPIQKSPGQAELRVHGVGEIEIGWIRLLLVGYLGNAGLLHIFSGRLKCEPCRSSKNAHCLKSGTWHSAYSQNISDKGGHCFRDHRTNICIAGLSSSHVKLQWTAFAKNTMVVFTTIATKKSG